MQSPLFPTAFIPLPQFSDADWSALEATIGGTFDRESRARIWLASRSAVSELVYNATRPDRRDIQSRLKQIRDTAIKLTELILAPIEPSAKTDIAVETQVLLLRELGQFETTENLLQAKLSGLFDVAKAATHAMKGKAGNDYDFATRKLIAALYDGCRASGIHAPKSSKSNIASDAPETATVRLVRRARELIVERANGLLDAGAVKEFDDRHLSPDEISDAKAELAAWRCGSKSLIVSVLLGL